MKAPEFWSSDGAASTLLLPLAAGWAAGARLRAALGRSWHAPIPVLCVGNLVVGGAGKTPVALALAARLPGSHLLCKGFGGSERGPARVMPGRDDAVRVGDEALLLAEAAPCWVARDRAAGARAASAAAARCLILDDGFQDPALVKDVSLLVVDGEFGFGNGHCLPAGPLREPIADGLARAQAVVLLGDDRAGVAGKIDGLPLLRARLEPAPAAVATLTGRRVLAFAGIGRPRKFFESLAAVGAELVEHRAFPDHHPYTAAELGALRERARRDGLTLVTTAKDAVRLTPELRAGITILPVTVAWQDEAALDRVLAPIRMAMP